jgi:hypothetical protein
MTSTPATKPASPTVTPTPTPTVLSLVGDRDALLNSIVYCAPGLKSASAGPDANLITIRTHARKRMAEVSTFNGAIQCRAFVPLDKITTHGRKLIMQYNQIQTTLDLTDKGDKIDITVPEDASGTISELQLKSKHGKYQIGLLDPDALIVPAWDMDCVGSVDYSKMMGLFNMVRLMLDDSTQFIRLQAVQQPTTKKFYMRIFTRTHRMMGMFYIEAPDITKEFTVYVPLFTFRKIKNLQSADIRILLPKHANDNLIGFESEDKLKRMVCGCEPESNQDVDDALEQFKAKPKTEFSWNIDLMHATLKRIEQFSAGRMNVRVPAGKTIADVYTRNNKHAAAEQVEVTGTEIGKHKEPFAMQYDTSTMHILHKLAGDKTDITINYTKNEDLDGHPHMGMLDCLDKPVDGLAYRVVFSLAHGLDT